MSYSVIISKNKITGLEEANCTQPKDAVPLSLFQDLSAYVYNISGGPQDISNLQQELNDLSVVVYDLSAVVYDLSGVVYDLSGVVYDLSAVVYDLSTNIYLDISNIQTEIFDLSYYVYNDLSSGGGSINIGSYSDSSSTIYPGIDTLLFDASNFSLDVSGTTIKIDVSGGGGGDVTFSDISNLFFDKPKISTDCSGYSTGSQNITINWTPPAQTKAAFNFVNPLLGQTTTNNSLNFLPYMSDLIIGYQQNGSSIWTDFTYSSDVTNSNNFVPKLVNKLDVSNTGSSVIRTVVANGSFATINLNLSAAAVGQSYKFRIAYTNNSEDTSWNYLYCPDPSYISFGNPGPAYAPSTLSINSNNSYNELDVGGSGGSAMDTSLNLAWGTQVVKIGYGLDVSGQRSNNSVQVDGYSTNQFTFDVSLGWWNGSNYYAINWTTSQDNFAYPEYLYNNVANTYYAVNSAEDFSRSLAYYTGQNKADGVIIPSRSTVTSDYDSFLNGTLNASNDEGYTKYLARRRDTYTSIDDIYFLGDNSGINFTDNTSVYKLAANYGTAKTSINPGIGDLDISFVEVNSMLGKTCSGEDICYVESRVIGNSGTILDLSSTPRMGFIGQDSSVIDSTANITLSSSATKELGSSDIRKKGFYLGFDLSQVKLTDISLGVLRDICNNNYQPYEWELEQKVYKSDGGIETESLTPFPFNLAKKPEQNTDLSNISISVTNPSLSGTAKFYGLPLPTDANADLKFPVSFTITNLDPTWAPSDATSTASLYDVSLVYDPNGHTSYSNGAIDRQNSNWVPSASNETYTPTITDLMVDYTGTTTSDYNNFKYSRDISGTNYGAGEQFKISVNLRNNVTLSPTNSQSYTVSNDLSGNGKAWWWDFTWDIGYTNIPNQTQPPTSVFGTLPTLTTIQLVKSLNPYTVDFSNSIPTAFDGTDLLTYDTAMWAKDGWFGDNSANIPFELTEYPYIDFSSNFYGLNEDYSVYDGSGVTQDISYNNVNIFNSGIVNVTENNLKWAIFKIYRQQSGTNKLTWKATTEVNGITYSNTLSRWETDYRVFYMEEDDTGALAYNVSGQTGQQSYTPWLDVQNIDTNASSLTSFLDAQPGGTNNGCNAASTAGAGTGQIQRFRSGATNFIYQYLAFGLKQGVKLKGIEISYV